MLDFQIKIDPETGEKILETPIAGKTLMTIPQLNKGTAFTLQERLDFDLIGKLPCRIETMAEQVERAYTQCLSYDSPLEKNIYLNNLHDKNQTLFYALLVKHLDEFISVIYTPTVGEAVSSFSLKFRQARGMYMSYPERDYIGLILENRSNPEIDIVVITDGEAVLGIGDQGIGAMDIPIAKLMVYSLVGGIDPSRCLPITIDVGTDNETLLNSPVYLGWKHKRLRGQEYDDFIDAIVRSIREKLPNAFIHWEDFGTHNARAIMERYKDVFCSFNDDIQGTGATTLAAIWAALNAQQQQLKDQRIVIFGAGAAGTGIADQLVMAMQHEGLTKQQAQQRIWLIDRQGLLTDDMTDLRDSQKPYARKRDELLSFTSPSREKSTAKLTDEGEYYDLLKTVQHIKPTILIGCSAQAGAFTQEVIQTMAQHVAHPIILPLSNPTSKVEATPHDIIHWTHGSALVATGSPFAPVKFNGKEIVIAQCNNARIFPGIGLGVVVAKPKLLTDSMLLAAARALCDCAPVNTDLNAPLLPSIKNAQAVSKKIARAVAKQAIKENLSSLDATVNLEDAIAKAYWQPTYLNYRRKK
jgi:malate dehydrogenase (oxaloacetate-decarboxylating)